MKSLLILSAATVEAGLNTEAFLLGSPGCQRILRLPKTVWQLLHAEQPAKMHNATVKLVQVQSLQASRAGPVPPFPQGWSARCVLSFPRESHAVSRFQLSFPES